MTAPLRVALLGYGYASKTFHAPLIVATGMQLAAVQSSSAAKVHADWPDAVVHADAAAVFADPAINLVVIATPNDTHYPLAHAALLAGKHVVVDKPFTLTVAEARKLDALAATQQRVLSVFHNRRWDADFLTIKALIEAGALGEVAQFESHFDRFRPEVRQRWREGAGPGAGLWYDLGPHIIDQALQLFGPPLAVFADLAQRRSGAQSVDDAHVLLRYANRRVVLSASMLVAGGSPRFVVHGAQASFIKYGLDTQEDMLKAGARPGCTGWGHDTRHGELLIGTAGEPERQALPTLPGDYRQYYAGVRDAISQGTANPVPAHQAIMVMEVLELAMRSGEARQELAYIPAN
ncbi:scyllo-inositol 2-dehydrogenase (NADP(+)) [Andreprevotia sp. IGB-42]|uniref:oxidoreductase n=1 Tax=Andreprevotia sp. IGB-42 TaxID=2497473 RepID=UPI00135CD2DD|nr:oxidoreductase [Andreprevotia sp. IGB-42]KAF0814010.1 scyllo-inositol 2-dehydrogenase (NADP(+)) [Andreprevotia sp. IGB-42]